MSNRTLSRLGPLYWIKNEYRRKKVQNNEKLNLLYLVDSIVKNVGGNYIMLFERKIVKMFENTFLTTVSTVDLLISILKFKDYKLATFW